ncbi:MAG TPA: metal-dependent hydrolase [Terriglobales bacterium]|jgi:L-ascorbate metabolism protein UlaG (beta-lactamase superfamily)|nr:metal-dependent hydrolase [Terriglobales bacterium]
MDLQGAKLTWLGHATFKLETPGGKTVLIDPWVAGNPSCPEDQKTFAHVDVMLVTHAHFDHIADVLPLAKQHDPKVVGIFELVTWLEKKGVKQIAPMNKGGSQTVSDIRVTMVHADHSCGLQEGDQILYAGEACGYVIGLENGLKIYHAGDTNVFGDMRIIHELYKPDLALLPIGDLYTMSPKEAGYACELLRPKAVVPMHFGTFPLLTGTPAEFRRIAADLDVEIIELRPGQTLS